MFQQVFDYPYLSSSANHIFDLTIGFAPDSVLSASSPTDDDEPQQESKINIYNTQAKILVGTDITGSILDFTEDGSNSDRRMRECFFINFARLLTKDEIQKGTFSLQMMTGGVCTTTSPKDVLLIQDLNMVTDYKTNSVAGEYGLLATSSAAAAAGDYVGHIYYQAGIAAISASIFDTPRGTHDTANYLGAGATGRPNFDNIHEMLTGSSISGACDAIRNRFYNVSFNNTTAVQSTIYWCRANHSEFNYSSNPTYLSGANGMSQIRVKSSPSDQPKTYITAVGGYDSNNELCWTAKTSVPIKKTNSSVAIIKVMINY